jgi:CubicO group peptidase (beta-lactamase class C family)
VQVQTPEELGFSSSRLARIGEAMRRYTDEGHIAGMVTLIARHGRIAHAETHGVMDRDSGRPMVLDAIMRIYSMTKPITSVAAMMLYEEGRFQMETPVSTFLPEMARFRVFASGTPEDMQTVPLQRPITVHHLLTHTAGLTYGFDRVHPVDALMQDWSSRQFKARPTLAEWLAALPEVPLAHQPGTAWRYSVATDVLGRLIEVVSGQSLDAFFRNRIFEPLGMADTGFFVPRDQRERMATLYMADGEGLARARGPMAEVSRKPFYLSGGGGLVSTTEDYLRFAQMLLNKGQGNGERLLGPRTVEFMARNHLKPALLPYAGADAPGSGFGLGVAVTLDPALCGRLDSAGSFGWGGAAATQFWVDPQEDLVALIMPQLLGSPYPLLQQYHALVYQALID